MCVREREKGKFKTNGRPFCLFVVVVVVVVETLHRGKNSHLATDMVVDWEGGPFFPASSAAAAANHHHRQSSTRQQSSIMNHQNHRKDMGGKSVFEQGQRGEKGAGHFWMGESEIRKNGNGKGRMGFHLRFFGCSGGGCLLFCREFICQLGKERGWNGVECNG